MGTGPNYGMIPKTFTARQLKRGHWVRILAPQGTDEIPTIGKHWDYMEPIVWKPAQVTYRRADMTSLLATDQDSAESTNADYITLSNYVLEIETWKHNGEHIDLAGIQTPPTPPMQE